MIFPAAAVKAAQAAVININLNEACSPEDISMATIAAKKEIRTFVIRISFRKFNIKTSDF